MSLKEGIFSSKSSALNRGTAPPVSASMPMAIVPPVEIIVILFSGICFKSIKHYGSELLEHVFVHIQADTVKVRIKVLPKA